LKERMTNGQIPKAAKSNIQKPAPATPHLVTESQKPTTEN